MEPWPESKDSSFIVTVNLRTSRFVYCVSQWGIYMQVGLKRSWENDNQVGELVLKIKKFPIKQEISHFLILRVKL